MPRHGLSAQQRSAIHSMALNARELLVQETRELLQGTYGIHADGRREPLANLPTLTDDTERQTLRQRLETRLDQERDRGVKPRQAIDALVTETAFTQLNRLAAYKMMEARALIREAIRGYPRPNGLLFYLADHPEDLARYESGRREDQHRAYTHYLLHLASQVSAELRVLFDPDDLAGRLFPRPTAMARLIDLLNDEALAPAWQAEETVGWIYQFFNEPAKDAAYAQLNAGGKLTPEQVPVATQAYTPEWIVRYLVHNSLGRLWLRMHPDSRLATDGTLDYLIPLDGEEERASLRPVGEITLLDPACGSMHFGLVAYDLFRAMYLEELDRAGQPGWPDHPSVETTDAIPEAILARNLHGIDLDKRAIQLSALALYLRARQDAPERPIARVNLAVADVRPIDGQRLGTYLREAALSPTLEKLVRELWARIEVSHQLGSLLPLERQLERVVAEARRAAIKPTLFDHQQGLVEEETAYDEYWAIIGGQAIQTLDEFARRHGDEQRLFVSEARKGFELLEMFERRYDVVVTNPPYSSTGNLVDELKINVRKQYPEGKGDLYAAFIQRCVDLADDDGMVGMITQQSFMFLSSYEKLRDWLRERVTITTMAHTGPRAFAEISGEVVNTTAFVLRKEPDPVRRRENVGTYVRLVQAGDGGAKRRAYEETLAALRAL